MFRLTINLEKSTIVRINLNLSGIYMNIRDLVKNSLSIVDRVNQSIEKESKAIALKELDKKSDEKKISASKRAAYVKRELDNKEKPQVKSLLTQTNTLNGKITDLCLPNNIVGIPLYFTKSSIYAPRDNRSRGNRNVDIPVWTQNDLVIRYKGPELDTKIDYKLLSILLKAIDLARFDNNIIKLNYRETLKLLQLNPYHPDSRNKFNLSVERHLSAKFMFSTQDGKEAHWKTIFNADNTYISYSKNVIKIELNDIVKKLFRNSSESLFTIEDMMLSFGIKSSYAIKLYSYYESNQTPYPVKLSTIFKICDKPFATIKEINGNHKAIIRKALNELVELGFLESWHFGKSKVVGDPLVFVNKIDRVDRDIKNKIDFNNNFLNYIR